MSKKLVITQSMIKEFGDYKLGKSCGLQFKAKYLDGIRFESSPVQKLGQYFEYVATGALTKHGETPKAEYITRGDNKGNLKTEYARMMVHVQTFHKTLSRLGFKPISVGKTVHFDGYEGTWDVELIATKDVEIPREGGGAPLLIKKGDKIILDLKTSGMLENKWDDLGWEIDSLPTKDKLMFQAVMYTWLGKMAYDTDYHFIFNVYSNTNDVDCKLIYIEIDEDRINDLGDNLSKARYNIEREIERGFRALPELRACSKCAIAETCPSFTDMPAFHIVQY